ncbi:hypothetical protein [Streptomyces sp. CA-132043]
MAGLYGNNFHRADLDATRAHFVRIGLPVPAFVALSSLMAL